MAIEIVELARYQVGGREFTSKEDAEAFVAANAATLYVDDYVRGLSPKGPKVQGGARGERGEPTAKATEAYQTRARRAIVAFLNHLRSTGGSVNLPEG